MCSHATASDIMNRGEQDITRGPTISDASRQYPHIFLHTCCIDVEEGYSLGRPACPRLADLSTTFEAGGCTTVHRGLEKLDDNFGRLMLTSIKINVRGVAYTSIN